MATEISDDAMPELEYPNLDDIEYVEPQAFGTLAETLRDEAVIGLDTEFMRETTFLPELCLLQVATPRRIFCADPLGSDGAAQHEPADFWRTLADRCWVVHAGRQDIEVLYLVSRMASSLPKSRSAAPGWQGATTEHIGNMGGRSNAASRDAPPGNSVTNLSSGTPSAGLMPREIFDTQIAAALLGFAPQLGYAALMAELFGASIAKLHTRADWRRRPLPPEFLEYAAEDVQYLLPAREALTERLSALGRLEWARQDSADLLDEALYAPDPASAIDRLKGARYLKGRARRIAEDLAAWREEQALRLNRPRQWILRDAALLEIAVAGPKDERALSRIPALPPKTARRTGKELLRLVAAAPSGSDHRPPGRPDERHRQLLKDLQRRVAAAAARLEIVPEVVASRKELSAALSGSRHLRVFRGWRRELIGEELLGLLESQ